MKKTDSMRLAELSTKSGVPPRTIRFYIARGLLPGPGTAGRNATYGAAHLERLRKIEELKAGGLSLFEVAAALRPPMETPLPEPVHCLNFNLAPDVTVQVAGGTPPWRLHRIRRLLAELSQRLNEPEAKEK